MRRALARVAAWLAISAACACAPHADYVRADAGTYALLAPYTEAGILADPDLDEQQKRDRLDLLESWEFRIRLNGGFDANASE